MRRLPPQQYGNPRVRRERDRAALRRQIVMLVCGMLAAGGFVLAVGQRFAAVRYGYRSEQLREERAHLVAERERLLLELSTATSPPALEQAAREIGMQPAHAAQIGDAGDAPAGRAPVGQREAARATAHAATTVGVAHVGAARTR
ncbi:MAG: cell division protein FtsL [Acidobacteria bacterium]|nr:cell division protein FtsL [Acidobacteriota bacterium]